MWLLFALQLRASAGRGHKGSTYHAQHQQQRGADFLDKEQYYHAQMPHKDEHIVYYN